MEENVFVARLRNAGAHVYVVGGWVRDLVRGVRPKDKDYMITGIDEVQFRALFPDAFKVGGSFPVFRLAIANGYDREPSEVAFARRERKTGPGYRGFAVEFDPSVTLEEDLFRRDTTMNALAIELPADVARPAIIDLYGGVADIKAQRIRAVSQHFLDDPVRALRAARQAAQFGFTIEEGTYKLMRAVKPDLAGEPSERIMNELRLALASPRPSLFFLALQRAGLLETIFPELYALIGKTQPVAFHPEGDAFNHTMLVLDEVAAETDSLRARFAGLAHDLGKGVTPPEMLPHHYGHEVKGLDVLEAWNRRMTLPHDWLAAARFTIREHMRTPRLHKSQKIVDLLLALDKSVMTIAEYQAVIRADSHGLPSYLAQAAEILPVLKSVSGKDAPAGLEGAAIGKWIRDQQVRKYVELCRAAK